MKKIHIKQNFAIIFKHLTQKFMDLMYRSSFLVHFTMLAPVCLPWDTHDNLKDF